MSSILDALKKLEEEKAREADDPNAPLDRAIAAHELTGRGRGGFEITPMMLGMFVAATAVFVVGVAMGAAILVVRAQDDRPVMAREMTVPVVAPSAPTETSPEPLPVPEAPPEPLPVTDAPAQAQPVPQAPAQAQPVPQAAPQTPPEPMPVPQVQVQPVPADTSPTVMPAVPAPVPSVPTPSIPPAPVEEDPIEEEVYVPPAPEPSIEVPPAPVYIRDPAPVVTPRPAAPLAEPDPPVRSSAPPEDPRSLPYLSRSVQDRLGIPDLKVNMVSRASRNHPRPSALINYNRVYLDEKIPETNARLISISIHGIAIEVNGQQYYVPQR